MPRHTEQICRVHRAFFAIGEVRIEKIATVEIKLFNPARHGISHSVTNGVAKIVVADGLHYFVERIGYRGWKFRIDDARYDRLVVLHQDFAVGGKFLIEST